LANIDGLHVSMDGHTRLYLAIMRGYRHVFGFYTEYDPSIIRFVREAKLRDIFSPQDLILLSHEKYEVLWNDYCRKLQEETE
jgi:hypothetical protein